MKDFTQVMKALSDPNRVRLLKMLQVRPLCVCEIQAVLGIAQPTVSKHLKILENAGLVTSSKDGLWVNYCLSDGERNPYAATLLGNLRHWLSGDPEVMPAIGAACTVRRTEIQKKSVKRPGEKKKPGRRPGRPRSLEG
ncbi:MAG TPA: metalloregulator ArsR/SmtB family transcription factor [Syntrophales bacterium]|nr:metalloregulator ArsR/SmtB family transcription factor [Syntrophales bacterium]HQN78222.1 metalloregulator ArsR/SmtB family transcription factor [Syntrophales bacterium]HQQ27481.1 metalloregulator ArsR/SmtB family transcription factor [Syntrophales bacterium]